MGGPVLPPGPLPPSPIAASAGDIIRSAMRLINVLASGEQPSGPEMGDGLFNLNCLVDSWNAERLMIYTIQRQALDVNGLPFNLTPGQQTYKVGPNGDFNIPRPPRIDRMGIVSLNNPSQPLELPLEYLTDAGWQAIPVKNIQSTLPQKVWNDNSFPFMNLSYWCIPSVQVQTVFYLWQALSYFPDATSTLTFPPAYVKALRFSLAVDLAPEFGRQAPPEVMAQAAMSKAIVKSINAPLVDLRVDSALVGSGRGIFNWLTGESTGTRSVS
jgi:hypothetical protein